MKNHQFLLDRLIVHQHFIITAMILMVGVGIIALIEMPRDEFPEFKIRQGLIVGIYPGATSEQIEEQLTKKVENYLFQFDAVEKTKTHSISKENVMVIYVEVRKKETNPKVFWGKLQHGLNELKKDLPAGVVSLTVNDDFGNTSAILLAIESETRSYRDLEQYIEKFEDRIRQIPATSRVKRYGMQKEEINIYIDETKISQYGIKPVTVLTALKPYGIINYAGELDDGHFIRPIHVPSVLKTETDIANQIVYTDPMGHALRIRDVARVVREYTEPESFIRLNGKKCLIVSLEMQPGNNIVRYGEEVKKATEQFIKEVPSDVFVGIISDMPHFVANSIYNFMKEFGIAVISVILVTVLLLPRRVALVAASSIPISIFITLGIMWITNMNLQTVSLAGLIIVLGMVVDNAIVLIDSYIEKLDHGLSRHVAASQSVTELFGSVFSATLILIFTYVPMVMVMSGLARDFIESMPYTIFYALSVSLMVSIVLVPLMNYRLIQHGIRSEHRQGRKVVFLNGLQRFYDRIVEKSFQKKKTIVGITAVLFIAGIIILRFIPKQMFPAFERNQFAVEVYLPTGSSLQETDRVMRDLENILSRDPRVREIASFIGTSSPRFHTLYAPNFPAKHYGQFLVITESGKATIDMLNEYSDQYSNAYPNAHIRWKQLEMSSSASPIEIHISGDSIPVIRRVASEVAEILRDIPGIQWIRTDYEQPLQGVRLVLRKDESARLGYSKTILDYSLMAGTRGLPVSTIWENDYPVPVNLKIDKKIKSDVNDILNQYVTSPFLVSSAKVRQIADAEPEWTEGVIARRNGIRTITVSVDPKRNIYASEILRKAMPRISKVPLPAGVSIRFGGEHQMEVEEVTPMYYSMAISLGITLLILLFQFRNIKTALLIMITMPLSIFGAALGILITGYPFGVTAIVGLSSLMGIIVRNGIIYISYAEELRREHGHTLEEASLASAKRRMRPIFLTAAAAAVGVVPMILSGSPLWGPLGAVICFGLIFGMILSLIVLPILYYLFHQKDFEKLSESEIL